MNIYLDIDGVLIGSNSPQKDRVRFIKYILKHYPDSTFWLTSHCRKDVNRTAEQLQYNGDLPKKLIAKMDRIIQPNGFDTLKTDGIDFSKPFLWFDDNLFYSEKEVLQRHKALDSHIMMNKKEPKMAKIALKILKEQKLHTDNP